MLAFWIIVGIAVAAVAYGIFAYNNLVRQRQLKEEGWSGIDVQLKRRADLIPNLLESVKGYMGHERETLEAVVKARAAATAGAGGSPEERAKLEGALSGGGSPQARRSDVAPQRAAAFRRAHRPTPRSQG